MGNESDHHSRPVRIPKTIPSGWKRQPLLDCCWPKQWPTLGWADMSQTGFPVYGANGHIGFAPTFTHEHASIVVGCRGTCGTIQVIPPKSYINGNAMVLEDIDQAIVLPDFLYYALLYRNVSDAVTGSAQPQITRQSLKRVTFPLPEKAEQAAIVRHLQAVDVALTRTRKAIEKSERFKRGLMQQLLPPWVGVKHVAPDVLGDGIEVLPASSVARIANGSTPSRAEPAYWRAGTIPWLATGKVNDRIITEADEYVTEKALAECSIELLPPGTVLVGMIGQGKTRGMTAFLSIAACINQNFGAFVPGPRLDGKFLYHYFSQYYSPLREIGGGTNQGALNCYILKRIRIPVLPIERQRQIAEQLDACATLATEYERVLERLERLKRGLMQDLLTGKRRVKSTTCL